MCVRWLNMSNLHCTETASTWDNSNEALTQYCDCQQHPAGNAVLGDSAAHSAHLTFILIGAVERNHNWAIERQQLKLISKFKASLHQVLPHGNVIEHNHTY